jgi:hypothetical protein
VAVRTQVDLLPTEHQRLASLVETHRPPAQHAPVASPHRIDVGHGAHEMIEPVDDYGIAPRLIGAGWVSTPLSGGRYANRQATSRPASTNAPVKATTPFQPCEA